MSNGRSQTEFLEFLDWLGAKGLLPPNTAHARKAVANKVLAALEPAELSDITALDVDDVMLRFTNKFGKRYTFESLRTYRSRFETSVSDFKAYCESPVGFRPAGRIRTTTQANENGEAAVARKLVIRRRPSPKVDGPNPTAQEMHRPLPSSVVPVQIRENLTVSVGPIPYDFTEAEAKRVANVILALAVVS